MRSIWMAIPCAILIALCFVAACETWLSQLAWWCFTLICLSSLAVWKFQVRRVIGTNWDQSSAEAMTESSRPFAYVLLVTYFISMAGFFGAIIASQVYSFRIPVAGLLAFLSLWWIKVELLACMLLHTKPPSAPIA